MTRLILDTGVLVAGMHGRLDLTELSDEDDVALPAVVVAEYLTEAAHDSDRARRAAWGAFLDDVLEVVPVETYDQNVAKHHAELMSHVQRIGGSHSAHDLIVAATARATRRVLAAVDERARLGELPDVTVRLISTRARGGPVDQRA